MATIIKHNRKDLATVSGKTFCQVELDATKYLEKGNKGETWEFHRTGAHAGNGFKVHFDKDVAGKKEWNSKDSPPDSKLDITVPGSQPGGTYKYTITYDFEGADVICASLDPIIIIDDRNVQLKPIWIAVATFAIGALAGYLVLPTLFG